ncbi:glycosyltransferase family 2 protein [Paraburkholderia sp. MM5384-R2]|uniref:glycosyltransferase family 2 protein n=1 Tax=Paraburkholderia sp. MM5384-R2 TaxID=2723097 RepID=UPI00161D454A|nr:glycosyltransferase family 2 protein [Paraburkholderia sp. MM5384-R2]MBB5497998.1 glycosyltransferase involved in cell wall biosynthesis [Paraburkholderia sp. MM5384-R2]
MSIKQGNDLVRAGDLAAAIREYKKIATNDPLYKFAEFNIAWAEKKLRLDPPAIPAVRDLRREMGHVGPKISIVMPVFNVGPYLDACILSVRYQTYSNFELIIVDDASTDNGMEIIRMHAELDSRIRVIHLDHNTLGGAGIPSNIGISAATGTYIGFVDSDDWITETAFENMVAAAERHQADVVIGGFRTFVEHSRHYSEAYDLQMFEKISTDKAFTAKSFPEVFRTSPVPWRKLYRRAFLENNQIAYPEGDYFYEDNPLHWFVLASHGTLVKVDDIISYHRMAREGQTMGAADFKLAAMCSHINTIGCFLADHVELPADQLIVDEFYDFCYRSSWISQRQEREKVKAIMGKRIAQIVSKNQKRLPAKNLRSNFNSRIEEFYEGYAQHDLTIVIPTYNCETFVEETLNCVLNVPGISTNVLVIDDGSQDRTAEICRKLEEQHDNLHFFQQKNRGAGRARNAVIPLCTGLYTFFLDADDVVDGRELGKAVIEAKRHGNDLYFMKYRIEYYEKNQVREMFNADKALWESFRHAKDNNELRRIASSLINYPWNRIIKTELLHDANIFFGATVVHNDIAFHWESLLAANNIGYGEGEVCAHRKFEQRSQITNVSDHRRLAAFDALEFTHHRIVNHVNGTYLIDVWNEFASNLVKWVKDRVPEDLQSQYEARKAKLLDLLASRQEEETHNV